MKIALNGATTMRADLATDLQAAKAASFDYLEIWAAKRKRDFFEDLFGRSITFKVRGG